MMGYAYNQVGGRGTRSGQALVLVVLLMMAVILVGILFVAVVGFNQETGEMMSGRLRADQLAQAGLRYADYMLTHSPQGADWRPPFRPYDPATYDAADPATWPVPPVYLGDPNAGPAAWTATPNMFGPDGIPFTDDDYYMDEEVQHGWAGLVNPTPPPGGPTSAYYARRGFTRYPDPNNAGNSTGGPLDQVDINQGHFLLRITYDPGPPFEGDDLVAASLDPNALEPDPRSRFLKIESIGIVAGTTFIFRPLVAYKALGLTDHILWVTDRNNSGRPALLGFEPWLDLDYNARLNTNAGQASVDRIGDFLPLRFEGPMRFNCPVELRSDNADGPPAVGSLKNESWGGTQIDLYTTTRDYSNVFDWRPYGGGYLRDDRFIALGIEEGATAVDSNGGVIPGQSTTVNLYNGAGSTSYSLWSSDSPNFNTRNGRILDNQRSDNPNRNAVVEELQAPDIFARDPATGQTRYHALTRDSGAVIRDPATNQTVHVGRYGHGPGIYIDNFSDVQFYNNDGTHDLQALMEDFLGNLSNNDPRIGDSGWNATRTMYAARGVEIELFHTPDAGLDPANIVTDLSPGPLQPNEVWWPGHVAGEPGLKLTRHDQRWRIADPTNPGTLGDDSGTNVRYVDYPAGGNQVIFAEGNVRIKGILPKDPSRTGRYNLTVVSGGTIYVEGQILSPQDVEGRYTPAKASGCRDEENSYLALLARDCVVVNPTQLVPVLTQGMVTAAPDDSAAPLTSAQHWELSPTLGGFVSTNWWFGAPPTSDGLPITASSTNTPDRISLVPYHTGADPGPAGVAMALYNARDNAWANYDFSQNGSGLYSFLLTPPFTIAPAPNVAEYLSPLWAPFWLASKPTLTWELNAGGAGGNYISGTRENDRPGDLNWLAFRYADPGLGTNGTNYWLKKFKLEALDPSITLADGRHAPKGAIHAKVNALMYAQDGCFFVIPGPLFEARSPIELAALGYPEPVPPQPWDDRNAAWVAWCRDVVPPYMARYRRLNYDLEIRGAIAENFHADPAAWRQWHDHWAYPQYFDGGAGPALAWGTITYRYDETMLASRVEPQTQLGGANVRYAEESPTAGGANLPKLPLLPTCPGLIYRGSGQ